MALLATIPYHTFPEIGPLKTFGLMVGLGVLVGAIVAAKYGERYGIERDQTYSMALRLVVAGVIGARLTWDVSHWNDIKSPLDLIAVWKGGLQFSGGFILAVIVGFPTFRKWHRLLRWRMLDGYAMGLTIGLAFGRIGCTSVGEHFGNPSKFLLAVRYDGGTTREPTLYQHATASNSVHGHRLPITLVKGMTFHNTSIYELIFLLVLFAGLWLILHRKPAVAAGTGVGIFCLYYGLARGASDFLRVNDKIKFGLTGAQWMCVVLIPVSIWILFWVRRATAALAVKAEAEEAPIPSPDEDDRSSRASETGPAEVADVANPSRQPVSAETADARRSGDLRAEPRPESPAAADVAQEPDPSP